MSRTAPSPRPGRPRSFDRDVALGRAMEVFWARGYEGTSYPELEAATGLHRQSLRYAFGDKASLFREAVLAYAESRIAAVAAALARPGPARANIEAVFDLWIADARPGSRGCLMVNTLAEFGAAFGAAASTLRLSYARLRDAFAATIRRAQAEGAIRPDLDPDILAAQFVALGDGLMLHLRAGSLAQPPPALLAGFLALVAAPTPPKTR